MNEMTANIEKLKSEVNSDEKYKKAQAMKLAADKLAKHNKGNEYDSAAALAAQEQINEEFRKENKEKMKVAHAER